jgi:hypothetical protein
LPPMFDSDLRNSWNQLRPDCRCVAKALTEPGLRTDSALAAPSSRLVEPWPRLDPLENTF